jgi:replicative DNA helicase
MTTVSDRRSEQITSGRVPPHSIESEESVIGSILLSSDSANEVMDKLDADDFYHPAHQAIFRAITSLYNANRPIDAITVTEELRRGGDLERVGGVAYVSRLLDIVPSAANIEYYAGIVEEHAQRRHLLRAGSTIHDLAFRLEDEIAQVLDRAEQTVMGVAGRKVGDGMSQLGGLFNPILEELEMLEAAGSEVTGLSTGFRDLDRKLTGLHPANLLIVAARPGMGKSSLTANIAMNVSMAGKSVAIFSLEMSKEEVAQRMLCSLARIDSMKLRTGKIGDAAWPRLTDAAGRLYDAPLFVDDSPVATVTDIRAKCRRVKRQHGLELIVVDYMQLMQGSARENRQQEIAEISRNLKNLARELEVPVIALSQLNRNLESREDKRPRLGDLRESGSLEQDADVVMFIYRDEYYNEQSEKRGIAEVAIAKHRAGATGTVEMTFMPEFTRFSDLGRD